VVGSISSIQLPIFTIQLIDFITNFIHLFLTGQRHAAKQQSKEAKDSGSVELSSVADSSHGGSRAPAQVIALAKVPSSRSTVASNACGVVASAVAHLSVAGPAGNQGALELARQ
jgi:hypothetical protein